MYNNSAGTLGYFIPLELSAAGAAAAVRRPGAYTNYSCVAGRYICIRVHTCGIDFFFPRRRAIWMACRGCIAPPSNER